MRISYLDGLEPAEVVGLERAPIIGVARLHQPVPTACRYQRTHVQGKNMLSYIGCIYKVCVRGLYTH